MHWRKGVGRQFALIPPFLCTPLCLLKSYSRRSGDPSEQHWGGTSGQQEEERLGKILSSLCSVRNFYWISELLVNRMNFSERALCRTVNLDPTHNNSFPLKLLVIWSICIYTHFNTSIVCLKLFGGGLFFLFLSEDAKEKEVKHHPALKDKGNAMQSKM